MKIASPNPAWNKTDFIAQLQIWRQEQPGAICKGLPPSFSGTFAEIGQAGFYLGDGRLPLPVAFVREDIMQRNRAWMTAFLHSTGVKLAPHGKTSMSPDLFYMQLMDGAWGMTAATAQQVSFYARMGIRRIILANQLTGAGNIAIVLDTLAHYPDLILYVLVDSTANVDELVAAIALSTRPCELKLLLEMGTTGGRTGVRNLPSALTLARYIKDSKGVGLAGIEGYEGIVAGKDQQAREAAVKAMLAEMAECIAACDDADLWEDDEIILTAGGTEFFDLCSQALSRLTGKRRYHTVIRSGCYVSSDSIAYARAFRRICQRTPDAAAVALAAPEGALEVWAAIQSRPEPMLAFATLGKRDVSHDWELPVPLQWLRPGEMDRPQPLAAGHEVIKLNDQHAYLKIPADSSLRPGDLIGFGISHACTTFDKWRCILKVDAGYRVTGAIRTFF